MHLSRQEICGEDAYRACPVYGQEEWINAVGRAIVRHSKRCFTAAQFNCKMQDAKSRTHLTSFTSPSVTRMLVTVHMSLNRRCDILGRLLQSGLPLPLAWLTCVRSTARGLAALTCLQCWSTGRGLTELAGWHAACWTTSSRTTPFEVVNGSPVGWLAGGGCTCSNIRPHSYGGPHARRACL